MTNDTYGSSVYSATTDTDEEESVDCDAAAILAGNLPNYYPASPNDDNYLLLKPIADELCKQKADIETIRDAISVKNADSMAQLVELGRLVDTFPEEGEGLEHYRARLTVEYMNSVGTGTANELVSAAAYILDVNESAITYENTFPTDSDYGVVGLGLPLEPLNDLNLTQSEFLSVLDGAIASGYRLTGFTKGTFTYITPTDYNSGNHNAAKGYDGLDTNGDPKGNGGTYAGLI